MSRTLLLAVVAVGFLAAPARAGAPAPPRTAADKFVRSDTVVVGKVTAIEKDPVEALLPYPGSKDKIAYTVAVVKVETAFVGAENVTHLKVGFPPPPKRDPNSKVPPRPLPLVPQLKEGQEVLLYLVKHPTAGFYVMPSMSLPADIGTEPGKAELAVAKRFAAVLADPMKSLKSDKAPVRAEIATLLVAKYRAYPEFAAMVEEVPIDAEESKLILKGLADGDWDGRAGGQTHPIFGFYQLNLTEKDGWKQPKPKAGVDFSFVLREAFTEWLAGPGKDYRIKKYVVK